MRWSACFPLCSRKKKRKNSRFWASQTPEVLNSVSKNWMAGIFPRVALSIRRRRWLLLPWRNTTTTKKRARKKREETRPRESKLPGVLEPPLSVLSRRRLFIHLPFSLFIDTKKTLDLCISKRKSKRWRKELPPFHPLSSIDRSIYDSNVCDFLARVGRARKKNDVLCACARARESEDLWDGHKKLFQIQKIYFPKPRVKTKTTTITSLFGKKFETHSC